MKGKIVGILIALPFLGVGVWMTWSIGNNLADAWQMRSWHPVDAELVRAGYDSHAGDDSTTYDAFAEYTYIYNGISYRSTRVGIAGGADNIGDYQVDMGNRLGEAHSRGQPVVVYVNPDDPAQAVIDRSPRWGMLGFKSIFMFVFGGVGLGLIIFLLRSSKPKDMNEVRYQDSPWLANDGWLTASIKSNSRAAMFGTWGFAIIWNLISAPLPFVIYSEVTEKGNLLALVGLLFPLVGAGLISWAVRRTLEWRRFGPAPVILDPFPGAIGGHVGGMIDVRLPYDIAASFQLTLTCVHSYMSGSGKDRSRREKAKWQNSQGAHTASSAMGTRLSFRFDVPEDLTESDATREDEDYYLWRLNLKAELPGTDIDRDYDIPVYPTGESSRQLSEFSIQQAQAAQEGVDEKAILRLLSLGHGPGGRSIFYPMGRNLLSGLGGLVFGSVFGGVGLFLLLREDQTLIGGVFTFVGLLIVIFSLYSMLNSLEVSQDGDHLYSSRRILGFPMYRSQMRRSEFARLKMNSSMQSSTGNKHVMHYTVYANDLKGEKITVGEGFKGAGQAQAAMRLIARELGLTATNFLA